MWVAKRLTRSEPSDKVVHCFLWTIQLKQLADQTVGVDFSVGCIDTRLYSYEMSEIERTARTALIRASTTRLLRLTRPQVGVHQSGEEFPKVRISGDTEGCEGAKKSFRVSPFVAMGYGTSPSAGLSLP